MSSIHKNFAGGIIKNAMQRFKGIDALFFKKFLPDSNLLATSIVYLDDCM